MVLPSARRLARYATRLLVKDLIFHLPMKSTKGFEQWLLQLMTLGMYWNRQGNRWINSLIILINLLREILGQSKFQLYTYTRCSWLRKMLYLRIWICWSYKIMYLLVIFGRQQMNKRKLWQHLANKDQWRFSYMKIIISLDPRTLRPMSVPKYFNWL